MLQVLKKEGPAMNEAAQRKVLPPLVAGAGVPDRQNSDIVLIVDDMPDNLSFLHDALDQAGYAVLVATSGAAALARAAQVLPDVILLDAMMPGMDGFEVARRLKEQPQTSAVPVIFMTGLTETEHVVAAYAAGGVDYVTKPIRPQEVLARVAAHMRSARQAGHARNALDAFGHATLVVRAGDGRLVWATPLARRLLDAYLPEAVPQTPPRCAAPRLLDWLRHEIAACRPAGEPVPLVLPLQERRLLIALHQQTENDEWLLVLRESSDVAHIEALGQTLKLTAKEAEVLYWVVKGKTNRDIGDILGCSAATVKKHLEHIYVKLGVETRTAAAGVAVARVAGLAQG
jgi:DNA-binding response OmpR family regulator/DNA-binding CsgD family transcriptional regulator